jgi:hypothetical protein
MPQKSILTQILEYCIKEAYLTVILVGLFSSGFLYFLRDTSYPSFFIITAVAWLASDLFILLFLRGGNGIVQVPIFGTKSQFKGMAFAVFFIAIFAVSVIVNTLASGFAEMLSVYLADPYVCVVVGFVLAGLVFVDLNAKYYTR